MQITFLIGNGFDIGIGLPSRFVDFFPNYCLEAREKEKKIRMLSEEIGKDYETWADFERALGGYTEKFTKDNKYDLIAQIKDFELSFIDYLKECELKLDYSDSNLIKNTFEKAIKNFYSTPNLSLESYNTVYKELYSRAHEVNKYNFINYNYTNTLNRCIEIFDKNKNKALNINTGTIINVHGKCDSYPILGVNDVSQIKNKELANDTWFTSRFVKPTINDLLRNQNNSKTTALISSSTIIIIYGMSIGETDKIWWQTILNWLNTCTIIVP